MTDDERRAVRAYAAVHGHRWRARLRNDMQAAKYLGVSADVAATLQHIRNHSGTDWMRGHRL